MPGINLKLQGQFKFDLYRPNGELIKSSDYVDNFITNSGVLYPYHFAFADCFRFLSVGVGQTQNSISSDGGFPTTGLASPIADYTYIGCRSKWDEGKESSFYTQPGNFGAGCGNINNDSGVSLIRQWTLPDNTGGTFLADTTFREFMVSPGRPYVTGTNGELYCTCNEADYEATGKDCSSVAEYYSWLADKYITINRNHRLKMCDASAAFARVIYDFPVVQNSILTITYKLNLIVDTGLYFTSLTHHRSDSVANWNHELNSYSSIVHPGVKLINDGTIYGSTAPNGGKRFQHFNYAGYRYYDFENEYGESFVPPMGIPMEPSNFFLQNDPNNQNIAVYLSDDNIQFLVNKDGGAFVDTGHNAPWNTWSDENFYTTYSAGDIVTSGGTSYEYTAVNPSSGHDPSDTAYWTDLGYLKAISSFSSGVMPFRNDNDAVLNSGSEYWSKKKGSFNIRRESGFAPDPTDVTKNKAMAANWFPATKAALPTFIFPYASSGVRDGSVIYTYSFENYRYTSELQVKSFVSSYKDLAYSSNFGMGDRVNLVPFFNAVFSGISGSNNVFIPSIETGDYIVAGSTGAIINGADSIDYNTLKSETNSIYPIISTVISWNVPCPPDVYGC